MLQVVYFMVKDFFFPDLSDIFFNFIIFFFFWLNNLAISRKDEGWWDFLFEKTSLPACIPPAWLERVRAGPWYTCCFVYFHLQICLLQGQLFTAVKRTKKVFNVVFHVIFQSCVYTSLDMEKNKKVLKTKANGLKKKKVKY